MKNVIKKTIAFLVVVLLVLPFCIVTAQGSSDRLIMAAANNNMRLVEQAVYEGADINAAPRDKSTALVIAVNNKNYNMSKFLLEHGANPNLKTNNTYSSEAPLIYAALNNDINIAELLLAFGADVNTKRTLGLNQTVEISTGYHTKSRFPVKYNLLDEGATPLIYAIQKSNTDSPSLKLVELLLKSGADANLANANGYTPLMAAADKKYANKRNERIEIATLLLNYGADPNITTYEGKTALGYAYDTRFNEMMELLGPYTPK